MTRILIITLLVASAVIIAAPQATQPVDSAHVAAPEVTNAEGSVLAVPVSIPDAIRPTFPSVSANPVCEMVCTENPTQCQLTCPGDYPTHEPRTINTPEAPAPGK